MPETLYKSGKNKILAGVCGGLGEYFKVDATLVRLGWVLAIFIGGSGLILYLLAMIIMPEEPVNAAQSGSTGISPDKTVQNDISQNCDDQDNSPEEVIAAAGQDNEREKKRHRILGLILIGLGGYFLVERFFPFFNLHNWWPVILIIIGAIILLKPKGGNG